MQNSKFPGSRVEVYLDLGKYRGEGERRGGEGDVGLLTNVTQRQLMRLFVVKLILSYEQKCEVRSKFLKN